jgi:hypothetical protein
MTNYINKYKIINNDGFKTSNAFNSKELDIVEDTLKEFETSNKLNMLYEFINGVNSDLLKDEIWENPKVKQSKKAIGKLRLYLDRNSNNIVFDNYFADSTIKTKKLVVKCGEINIINDDLLNKLSDVLKKISSGQEYHNFKFKTTKRDLNPKPLSAPGKPPPVFHYHKDDCLTVDLKDESYPDIKLNFRDFIKNFYNDKHTEKQFDIILFEDLGAYDLFFDYDLVMNIRKMLKKGGVVYYKGYVRHNYENIWRLNIINNIPFQFDMGNLDFTDTYQYTSLFVLFTMANFKNIQIIPEGHYWQHFYKEISLNFGEKNCLKMEINHNDDETYCDVFSYFKKLHSKESVDVTEKEHYENLYNITTELSKKDKIEFLKLKIKNPDFFLKKYDEDGLPTIEYVQAEGIYNIRLDKSQQDAYYKKYEKHLENVTQSFDPQYRSKQNVFYAEINKIRRPEPTIEELEEIEKEERKTVEEIERRKEKEERKTVEEKERIERIERRKEKEERKTVEEKEVNYENFSQKLLEGHTNLVNSVCFCPDNTKICSGSNDNTVKIWDAKRGECITTLSGHTNSVNSVCFSPDNTIICSGSKDKTVKIWDAKRGECITTLSGHTNSVTSVCFSPNDKKIIICSVSQDGKIKLWEKKKHYTYSTYSIIYDIDNKLPIYSVCFPTVDEIYIGDQKFIKKYKLDNTKDKLDNTIDKYSSELITPAIEPGYVSSLKLCNNSIWSTNNAGQLSVFDLKKKKKKS